MAAVDNIAIVHDHPNYVSFTTSGIISANSPYDVNMTFGTFGLIELVSIQNDTTEFLSYLAFYFVGSSNGTLSYIIPLYEYTGLGDARVVQFNGNTLHIVSQWSYYVNNYTYFKI